MLKPPVLFLGARTMFLKNTILCFVLGRKRRVFTYVLIISREAVDVSLPSSDRVIASDYYWKSVLIAFDERKTEYTVFIVLLHFTIVV